MLLGNLRLWDIRPLSFLIHEHTDQKTPDPTAPWNLAKGMPRGLEITEDPSCYLWWTLLFAWSRGDTE